MKHESDVTSVNMVRGTFPPACQAFRSWHPEISPLLIPHPTISSELTHPILSSPQTPHSLLSPKPAECPQRHVLIWNEQEEGPQHTVRPPHPLPFLVWRLSIMLRGRGDTSFGPEYERKTFVKNTE